MAVLAYHYTAIARPALATEVFPGQPFAAD
jgi:hypothetical protein